MKSFLSTLFLFGIAMLLASPAMAQCPDGPSFMDGKCMKDIYGIVYVAVPLGSQSPVLVNLDDDVDSAAGNSWGVTNAHPKFTIRPGKRVCLVVICNAFCCCLHEWFDVLKATKTKHTACSKHQMA